MCEENWCSVRQFGCVDIIVLHTMEFFNVLC